MESKYQFAKNKRYMALVVIFLLLGILSVWPITSKSFVFSDAPRHAIAMERYSVKEHFPAPPGPFLYIMAANFVNLFLNNPHKSLIFLAVIFKGLISSLLFFVGAKIFSIRIGIISAVLYIFSPLFWYYGSTAGWNYLQNGFFSLLAGYLFYEVIHNNKDRLFVWACFFYAVMSGFRPQEVIFLAPLCLWAFFNVKITNKIYGLTIFILTCLAWFYPMSMLSGGVDSYLSFIFSQTSSGSTRFSSNIFNLPHLLKANLQYQVITYFYTFGVGALAFIYFLPQYFNIRAVLSNRQIHIFLVWILPCLIFWSICNFSSGGYITVSLLPLFFLLAEFIDRIVQEIVNVVRNKINATGRFLKNFGLSLAIVFIVCINSVIYFYDFHHEDKYIYAHDFQTYPNLKKKDLLFEEKFKLINNKFDPKTTLIITTDNFFMELMYYLSEYKVYSVQTIFRKGASSVKYGYHHVIKIISDEDFLSYANRPNTGIKQVILFDDVFQDWDKSRARKEMFNVDGGYNLRAIYPSENRKIMYDFHYIDIG